MLPAAPGLQHLPRRLGLRRGLRHRRRRQWLRLCHRHDPVHQLPGGPAQAAILRRQRRRLRGQAQSGRQHPRLQHLPRRRRPGPRLRHRAWTQGNAYSRRRHLLGQLPAGHSVQAFNGGISSPNSDAFVTKVSASGNAWLYSTFLGGSGSETGIGVAVDASRQRLRRRPDQLDQLPGARRRSRRPMPA